MLFGKKFVYDQHDLCPEILDFKFKRTTVIRNIVLFLERCSYRLADLVIVTNQSAYEIASKRGRVHRAKLCIVRNGPDLELLDREAQQRHVNVAEHLVVYVGVMATQDGVDTLVRAADHIVHGRGRKDVRFALLGDGK